MSVTRNALTIHHFRRSSRSPYDDHDTRMLPDPFISNTNAVISLVRALIPVHGASGCVRHGNNFIEVATVVTPVAFVSEATTPAIGRIVAVCRRTLPWGDWHYREPVEVEQVITRSPAITPGRDAAHGTTLVRSAGDSRRYFLPFEVSADIFT